MSNQLRFQVVEEAFKKKALEVPTPNETFSTVRKCSSTSLLRCIEK